MTVVINFAWLFKQAAFFAKLPRIFPGSSNCNNNNSKAAKKRARNKRNSCPNEKKVSSNDATADMAEKSTPFHRLAPEKRCETKFQSKEIIKSPIFTAIQARTYNVLQILTLAMKNPCGRIPLPRGDENDKVFVSP